MAEIALMGFLRLDEIQEPMDLAFTRHHSKFPVGFLVSIRFQMLHDPYLLLIFSSVSVLDKFFVHNFP